jgi:endonuclease YncB( thermonuclease family)
MKLTLGIAVEIERIVDSDTLLVWLRVGPDIKQRIRLRLKGVEGGELGTDEGARGAMALQLALRDLVTGPFSFHGNIETRDQHGRIVGDLMDVDGKLLTLTLLASGAHWRRSRAGVEKRVSGPKSPGQ